MNHSWSKKLVLMKYAIIQWSAVLVILSVIWSLSKMLVELESCGFSLWISFESSGYLFVMNGQLTLNNISLNRNKCCRILLPAMTKIQSQFENIFKILTICVLAWKKNIRNVLSPSLPKKCPYSELLWSA